MDGLLVGRFQPFHRGHLHAVRYALDRSDLLHVAVGSAGAARSARNPFTADERRRMIGACVESARLRVFEVPDYGDHSRWAAHVARSAPGFGAVFTNDPRTRGVYEGLGVEVIPVPFEDRGNLSGTRVRRLLGTGGDWRALVPEGARAVLEEIGAPAMLASNYK